jgi:tetratricopeptide (TPR) repeat protein
MRLFAAAVLAALLPITEAGAATLAGKVLDRAGAGAGGPARGLAGARLVLHDTAGKVVAAKTSSRSGAYRFAKVKPGRYVLAVRKAGHLPSPLVRVIEIGPRDTSSRDFALDRMPMRKRGPAREEGRRRSPHGYYDRLALGILGGRASLCREAFRPVSPGRFFDAEDTTSGYRSLWIAVAWAEIESQDRPIEHRIFLAHALDSTLKAEGWPSLPALAPYLRTPPDSLEAYTALVRSMVIQPPSKDRMKALRHPAIPRSVALQIIEGHLLGLKLPAARKRAFLAKARPALGAATVKRLGVKLAAAEGARRQSSKSRRKKAPEAPSFDSEALWKVVRKAAGGKDPNPAARFHLGLDLAEAGRHREALDHLKGAVAARPDHARALEALALVQVALDDASAAGETWRALTALESTAWQARGWHGLARIQRRGGASAEAEASLVRSLGLDRASDSAVSALVLLAEISVENGTWSSVEPMLEELAAERPGEARAQYWLGRMALLGDRDGVALDRFRKARGLAADPGERARYAVAEASVHRSREECAQALRLLRPLRKRLDADGLAVLGACLLAGGRAREAAAEFERLHRERPGAASLASWARALNAAGQAEKAAELVASTPFDTAADILLVRAESRLVLERPAEARQALEPLKSRKPEDAAVHFLLGRAAWQERDYGEANRALTSALRYRQDYPEAVHLQGQVLLKLNRAGEAHHYFGELAGSDRKAWKARGLSGRGQAFAQEGKLEAAVENLSRSFREAPTAEAAAHMALVLLRQHNPAEAAGWAEKARKLDPDEPLALMAAVDALLSRDRVEEADALAKRGLERHPESCDFQLVAAKASLRAGRDAEARDLSLRASRKCPGEPAPHFYLGSLSARAGTPEEAKRHFGAYLEAGGDARRVPAGYR